MIQRRTHKSGQMGWIKTSWIVEMRAVSPLLPCMLFLPFGFVALVSPLFAGNFSNRTAGSHIAQSLLPASNTSIKELDQAVALLAGASVLGFSIYSVANAYYNTWDMGMSALPQSGDEELMALTRTRN